MSSISRKIQKNADNFILDQYYKNMTPEMYKVGIRNAIKETEKRLTERYDSELRRIGNEYNKAIQEGTLLAMDTLAVEMVYELGNVLECYVDSPEYLDQKIEIIQNIYNTAMTAIEDYASSKYKSDKQAQRAFAKKKKTIQKLFGMK